VTTQVDATIGIKKETVYGTAVTVDRHFEFLDESLKKTLNIVQGQGLRAQSRTPRSTRRSVGNISTGGAISFEAYSRGMGVLFEAALGTSTSTVISGAAFQQVHTPTLTDPVKSYTIQKGLPFVGTGAAANPHTFTGMVCNSIEFSTDVGGVLQIATEWMGKDMATATALAAPTYPSATNGQIFTFKDAALTIGGVVTVPTTTALATSAGTPAANVTSASVKWDNALDSDGYYIGGGGLRGRANVLGAAGGSSGSFTVEYTDNVLRDAYLAQTDLSLVLTYQGTVAIVASNFPTIQIVIPCLRLEGDVPDANGGGPVSLTVPFTGLDNTVAAAPFYIVYVTADTAV
jgi:hypothetical protein